MGGSFEIVEIAHGLRLTWVCTNANGRKRPCGHPLMLAISGDDVETARSCHFMGRCCCHSYLLPDEGSAYVLVYAQHAKRRAISLGSDRRQPVFGYGLRRADLWHHSETTPPNTIARRPSCPKSLTRRRKSVDNHRRLYAPYAD